MPRARPFRFGVFGETARSREALLDTARRAEESGYATFLIRDHFIEEPIGSVDQIVEGMQARREQYGFSYYVLFDHAIDEVAPIVARLAGE